jgi:hypothetical protein
MGYIRGGDTENQSGSYFTGTEMPFLCARANLLREKAISVQASYTLTITEGRIKAKS